MSKKDQRLGAYKKNPEYHVSKKMRRSWKTNQYKRWRRKSGLRAEEDKEEGRGGWRDRDEWILLQRKDWKEKDTSVGGHGGDMRYAVHESHGGRYLNGCLHYHTLGAAHSHRAQVTTSLLQGVFNKQHCLKFKSNEFELEMLVNPVQFIYWRASHV